MKKMEHLTRFEFFHHLPQTLQREMEAASSITELTPGAPFYQQGRTCPLVALIALGNIRVFRLSESGREITLYHVGEGETCLVNLLCAFLKCASPASAIAQSSVTALVVPADQFRTWVQTTPALQDFIFSRISERVIELMLLVEEVAFHGMDQRLAELLCRRAQQCDRKPREVEATHEQLAADLGAAREVVSRLLKDFERCGAVELGRGSVRIADVGLLRSLATTGVRAAFPVRSPREPT